MSDPDGTAPPSDLEARLCDLLARRGRPVARREVERALRLSAAQVEELVRRLPKLEAEGRVVGASGGRIALPEQVGLVTGRVVGRSEGDALVVPDDPEREPLFVPRRRVRPALHGDRVLARAEGYRRGGRPEGRIVRVLARGLTVIVGEFQPHRKQGRVRPRDDRISYAVHIPRDCTGGARAGDLVRVAITSYPSSYSDLSGKVEAVLGPAEDPRAETEVIVDAFGLPARFSPSAEEEAAALPEPDGRDGEIRTDLTALPFVTIDGEKARDFDDAVCAEPLPGGATRLWVAIADVAAYVRSGGAVDEDARGRGTSVYLPDRVIPMLPERLSACLCSLQADVPRLVRVVRIDVGADGTPGASTFTAATIRSRARLTYTTVRQAIVERDTEVRAALGPLTPLLESMSRLAATLGARRAARGSLDFDLPEAEIVIDLRGHPSEIVKAERHVGHRMIEEFMIAANEAVANRLAAAGYPFLYRVHEPPAPDAVAHLRRVLAPWGVSLPQEITPRALQAVLEAMRGHPAERLVNTALLRSMPPARYAACNLGHFGLASRCYTHFTSPIRRYPDLTVHRALAPALAGRRLSPAERARHEEHLGELAEHLSRRERTAMEAEREALKLSRVQLMRDKVGQEYAGVVSGILPFGFFVELEPYFVEGLVPLASLADDFYDHQADRYRLVGRRTGRQIRLGDRVCVRVAAVSLARREIDFALAAEAAGSAPRRRRARQG